MAQKVGKKFQNDYAKLGELLNKEDKTLNETIAERGFDPNSSAFAAAAKGSSITPSSTTTTNNNNVPDLNIGSSLDSLST
jgi:hypothetical protein